MYLFFIGNCRTGIFLSDIIAIASKCGLLWLTKDLWRAAVLYNEKAGTGWFTSYYLVFSTAHHPVSLPSKIFNKTILFFFTILNIDLAHVMKSCVHWNLLFEIVTMRDFQFLWKLNQWLGWYLIAISVTIFYLQEKVTDKFLVFSTARNIMFWPYETILWILKKIIQHFIVLRQCQVFFD